MPRRRASSLTVGDVEIAPGQRRHLQLPVARLVTQTQLSVPVIVVHGQTAGPRVWLSAAVHGDEICGVEIIRRVLKHLDPAHLKGTVLATPIVNVFGFISESRYLPDRRDLNRSFPGSSRGSLAARLAEMFLREIVEESTHGIDLHTGAKDRTNLPQIRADLTDPETRRCAEAFGAPIMIHSRVRDGSLREAATARGIAALLYEAGEPRRYQEEAIAPGVRGVLRVLTALGMTRVAGLGRRTPSLESHKTSWVRARRSGLFRPEARLGQRLDRGTRLGVISDAFGELSVPIAAPTAGLVIGLALNPLVNKGDAMVHIAEVHETGDA